MRLYDVDATDVSNEDEIQTEDFEDSLFQGWMANDCRELNQRHRSCKSTRWDGTLVQKRWSMVSTVMMNRMLLLMISVLSLVLSLALLNRV